MLKNLSDVLKFLREKKGYSKRQICLAIDLPTTTYGQYERGTNVPESPEVIDRMIDFYRLCGPDLDMILSAYFRSTLSERQEYILNELNKIHSNTVPQLFDSHNLEDAFEGFSPSEQQEIKSILSNKRKLTALLKFIMLSRD